MILFGMAALVQCLFLPGFLVSRLLGIRGGLRTVTTSLALSLVIDHVLVWLLVGLHIYTRPVVLALFAIECIAAIWLIRRAPKPAAPSTPATWSLDLATWIAAFAAGLVIHDFTRPAMHTFGVIFTGWDDVVSWNRWAVAWARGHLPVHTWHYPQLLPTTWSLTYVFMGTDKVQCFARAMAPLFSIATPLAVLTLARGRHRFRYFAATAFAGLFLNALIDITLSLADVPVAFFTAMALAELLRQDDDAPAWQSLLLGGLFAAGAAMTKQAGLYVAALYPVLVVALTPPRPGRVRAAVGVSALIAALALPWYVGKELQIRHGGDTSEVSYVTHDIYDGRAPLARASDAWRRVEHAAGGRAVFAIVLVLLAASVLDPRMRWITLLMTIPYSLVWALWFSYDGRNLVMATVPAALGCGTGLDILLRRFRGPTLTFDPAPLERGLARLARPALAVLVLGIATLPIACPGRALLAEQDRQQRNIGDRAFNRALYARDARDTLRGTILTQYELVRYLPGFESRSEFCGTDDAACLERALGDERVAWLITSRTPDARVAPLLDGAASSGAFVRVMTAGDHVLWERRMRR